MHATLLKITVSVLLLALITGTAATLCGLRLGVAAPPDTNHLDTVSSPPENKEDYPKSFRGVTASLSIDKAEYKVDEPMKVTITITCTKERQRMFDVSFCGLLNPPGDLLIRDSRGKTVNTLLRHEMGSQVMPTKDDWIAVPEGVFVGTSLTIRPTTLSQLDAVQRNESKLPVGEYTVQLVLDGLLEPRGEEDTTITTKRIPFRVVGRE